MDPKTPTFDVALKSTERQWVQKVPEVYTNDLHSVSLQFRITDCTDTELTGSTAIVLLKMRDGSFFQGPSVDVTRTLNVFSYTLKENEGNHDGLAEIQLIVTIGAKEFATQKYNFKVITGLDSEVAREIMIYDWSTLTREARAYIDEFTADELLRDAEFDNAQFDRNVAFNADQGQRNTDFELAQTQRNTDFGTDQAQRVSAFNASEAARVLAFNNAETARAAGYDADHSRAGTDHTGATTDRTNAATDRTNAATDRTNAAADRTLAGTDHTRAEGDHTQALANNATVAGFNGRLNDVETDTSLDATNKVTNGNFETALTGWTVATNATAVLDSTYSTTKVKVTTTAAYTGVRQDKAFIDNNLIYVSFIGAGNVEAQVTTANAEFAKIMMTSTPTRYSRITRWLPTWNDVIGLYNVSAGTNYYGAFLALDLTAIFGAGKEPTAAEMDRILARFPNSWFDGTKNLFQAKASLNKLMALDARTEFEMKNGVVNGDFSSGVAPWIISSNYSTLSYGSNTLFSTSLVTGWNIAKQNIGRHIPGNKLYVRARVRNLTGGISIAIRKGDSSTTLGSAHNITANTWYNLSGIWDTVGLTGDIIIRVDKYGETIVGDVLSIQYVAAIDLTAAFGAGKEPTLAEMDRRMARFPNSWFDGVKPIQTIETLYQEKANKVQEAWITPTLLNGWVQHTSFENAAYMKDEFGFVHFQGMVKSGTIGQTIFSLPAGYRPDGSRFMTINSNNSFGQLFVDKYGVVSPQIGSNNWLSLDQIVFKAEV